MTAGLSKRAAALLDRIRAGEFYRAYEGRVPAAMKELVDAKLVVVAGRVATIVAAFVPATGYTPYHPEQFVDPLPGGLKLPDDQADALREVLACGACVEVEKGRTVELPPGIYEPNEILSASLGSVKITVASSHLTTEAMVAVALLREAGFNVVDA